MISQHEQETMSHAFVLTVSRKGERVFLQALGDRCMSAEATDRPKFDEVLKLVDELNIDV